jgi:hypothetical protein
MFFAWGEIRGARVVASAMFALLGCMMPLTHAQAPWAAHQEEQYLSAGATGSSVYLQYGERKMIGLTGYVDLDARRRLGIEAEGRWIEFHQFANVHAETYSIGARYHRTYGRYQPYVKGLIGFGDFNFPYSLATGRYLVATAGGGLDLLLTDRIQIRAVDAEYQDWPQFTFGNMTMFAVSSGLRVHIF